jgi:16S rRNA (guanine966-N2)-methyltransferase
MRIIAGSHKGHGLIAPKGLDTRPTGDRVREAAFNLIGPVDGATVLDLFAGSGAMGLEALSRGAERAVFVESDRDAIRAIEANLDKLGLLGTVTRSDAVRAVAQEAAAGRSYDLVLVDPPYRMLADLIPRLQRHLAAVLAPDGLLVVESDAREEPALEGLELRTSRRYGSARLTLFGHE